MSYFPYCIIAFLTMFMILMKYVIHLYVSFASSCICLLVQMTARKLFCFSAFCCLPGVSPVRLSLEPVSQDKKMINIDIGFNTITTNISKGKFETPSIYSMCSDSWLYVEQHVSDFTFTGLSKWLSSGISTWLSSGISSCFDSRFLFIALST